MLFPRAFDLPFPFPVSSSRLFVSFVDELMT